MHSLCRLPCVLFVSLVLASCGGGGGGGGPGEPTETVLFEEAFDGAFPGGFWSAPAGWSIDDQEGRPAPALTIGSPTELTTLGHDVVHAGAPFSTAPGFTLYSFFALSSGASEGGASVTLVEANAPSGQARLHASVALERNDQQPGVTVQYYLLPENGVGLLFEETVPDDGTWHDFAVRVHTDGRATWYRDTVQKLSTGSQLLEVGSGELRLVLRGGFPTKLSGGGGGGDPRLPPYAVGAFDSILVTRP